MKKFTGKLFCLLIPVLIGLAGCKKDNLLREITPHDFLSADKYERLTVEVQYVAGFAPTQASLDNLKNFLTLRLNKPDGISFVQTQISSPGRGSYGQSDIEDVEEKNRKEYAKRKELVLYVLFLDGEFAGNSGNSKVLGIAYGKTSLCIFEKSIKEFSGSALQPPTTTLETLVADHEVGHVLGLVNNGTPMQVTHQDTQGRHCNNKNCLMYYLAETSDVIANLTGGSIPELDANCLDDLRANGGK